MHIIPAIDLRGGRCVRLLQGKRDQETVYADDPASMALRWQEQGATYLHLVDLDGAFKGASKNIVAIQAILRATCIPLELGGGIRTMKAIARLLSMGVDRVILGTVAITDPELVQQAIQRFGPARVVVGIDARDGRVAVKGWKEIVDRSAVQLAQDMRRLGVERIIYTDIAKDGMLVGPNLHATKEIAQQSGLKVVASGGISTLADVEAVAALEPFGVDGMIIGKALYEGTIDLKEVLELLSPPS